MKYSFIFFDIDDTLLNHRKAEKLALQDIWNEFHLNALVTLEQFQETYHHINVYLWEMYGRDEIGKDELQKTRFDRTLFRIGSTEDWKMVGDRYMECYQQHWSWVKGAKDAFEKIKAQYKVGLLTNGFADTQRIKIQQFGFDSPEICALISEEVGIMKPQPGIFEAATKAAGVPINEILYVGDSYTSDLLGATNFGWDVAWLTQETDPSKRALATLCFNDYSDLLHFLEI